MAKLPGANVYESFAYHVTLLRDFASKDGGGDPDSSLSHSGRRRVSGRAGRGVERQHSFTGGRSFTAGAGGGRRLLKDDQSSNGSQRSARSLRGSTRKNPPKPTSLQNGKMFGPSPKQDLLRKQGASMVF